MSEALEIQRYIKGFSDSKFSIMKNRYFQGQNFVIAKKQSIWKGNGVFRKTAVL